MAYIHRDFAGRYGVQPALAWFENPDDSENNAARLFGGEDYEHLADEYRFKNSEVLTLRCDPLLRACLDAVARRYDIARGEAVRRMLFHSLAAMDGEFFEDEHQPELNFLTTATGAEGGGTEKRLAFTPKANGFSGPRPIQGSPTTSKRTSQEAA